MTPVGESQVEDLVAVFSQRLNLHTRDTVKQTLELPIPRDGRSRDAIVAVEQLPPQELISGYSQPLPAGQTSSQHSIMGQTQENLQHQAVCSDGHEAGSGRHEAHAVFPALRGFKNECCITAFLIPERRLHSVEVQPVSPLLRLWLGYINQSMVKKRWDHQLTFFLGFQCKSG
uniref:Uncharacterized protein n=1 Tax=Sphaeramia orbicularis TaxID=375764 RepID=A0A672ZI97_9TELE